MLRNEREAKFAKIKARLNKACNFFADTTDVDYCEGIDAATITRMDSENRQDIRIFPELKKMGY